MLALTAAVRERASQAPLLLALDGGATTVQGCNHREAAAWAIVGNDSQVLASGFVWRRERTAAAAERQALYILACALRQLEISVVAIFDNLPLVLRLQAFRERTGRAIKELRPFWSPVVEAVAGKILPLWVPSHGKPPEWRPRHCDLCEVQVRRRLNQAADDEVSRLLRSDQVSRMMETLRHRWRQAKGWSLAALQVQALCTKPYHDLMRSTLSARKLARRSDTLQLDELDG